MGRKMTDKRDEFRKVTARGKAAPKTGKTAHQRALLSKSELDRPLAEILGIRPEFAPDAEAPPIDEELIENYLSNHLPNELSRQVALCIARYECWFNACTKMMRRQPPK